MVDFDGCFFQVGDQVVVGQIVLMSISVDMGDLQCVELMFVLMMVMVGVLVSFDYCLFGNVEYV